MAIVQSIATSFGVEVLKGLHDFSAAGGDTFKIALYSEDADLGPATTAYTATNEVSGTGYTAGGAALTNIEPTTSNRIAYVDFDDVTFSTVTLSARGAMIYNSTNGDRAVAVLDFGRTITKNAADLVVNFPAADSVSAILKVSVQ